jgi:hypothetical protein
MIEKERVTMKGELTIVKTDDKGHIETTKIPNLVVTAGKSYMISRMISNTTAIMSHMAVGSGIVTPILTDTALETIINAPVVLVSTTQNINTVTYVATFGPGVCTGAITEAGIFNALSAGDMLCRTSFPVVNKAVGDSISITWVVQIA